MNLGPGRVLTTDNDSLDTVLEKAADPSMSSILNAIAIEFLKKPVLWGTTSNALLKSMMIMSTCFLLLRVYTTIYVREAASGKSLSQL